MSWEFIAPTGRRSSPLGAYERVLISLIEAVGWQLAPHASPPSQARGVFKIPLQNDRVVFGQTDVSHFFDNVNSFAELSTPTDSVQYWSRVTRPEA